MCGTYRGFKRHVAADEDPCDDCRQARRVYNTRMTRERRRRNGAKPRRRPRCGTLSGRTAHFGRGESPCPACRAAFTEWQQAHRAGLPYSRRHDRLTAAELVADVLETYGYAMTAEVLISHVLDIRPDWKPRSVRRAIERMVSDGRLERFERLGENLVKVAAL